MATLAERLAQPDMQGLTEAEAAAALNTPAPANGSAFQDVDPRDWLETLVNTGEWGRIELAASVAPSATVLSAPTAQDTNVGRLRTFVRACTSPLMVRASRASVRTVFGSIIDALATANFISAGTATTLKGFAQRNASWAEANGFPNGVTARDVGLARGAT